MTRVVRVEPGLPDNVFNGMRESAAEIEAFVLLACNAAAVM